MSSYFTLAQGSGILCGRISSNRSSISCTFAGSTGGGWWFLFCCSRFLALALIAWTRRCSGCSFQFFFRHHELQQLVDGLPIPTSSSNFQLFLKQGRVQFVASKVWYIETDTPPRRSALIIRIICNRFISYNSILFGAIVHQIHAVQEVFFWALLEKGEEQSFGFLASKRISCDGLLQFRQGSNHDRYLESETFLNHSLDLFFQHHFRIVR
mmetsp:Transcript_8544/g.14191  ORF Transcript_8544/g.14191 Transcript_8544/m.14191 type:complete len:211 (+) Transcript_8544:517-1149(+)